MQRYTIKQFNEDFPDEAICLEYVAALAYPTFPEIHCRTCGEVLKHHRLNGRKAFSCQRCGTHVYPLAGTIFEKSRTPLKSWFYAMYLMSTTRMGISAKQLERELGVTYKTAWRMFRQIRALMDEDGGVLSGTVEVDETFVGGKPRNRQPRKGARPSSDPTAKKPVVGMVERGGDVKAWVAPNVRSATIRPLMEAHIMPASMVYTDEARQYVRVTMTKQIATTRTPNTSGTRLLLGAGMVVASLGHGAIIGTVVGAVIVSWWAIPLHLLCVWFTGNMVGNRGRNRNIGHALGLWLGVLGLLVALGVDSKKDDLDQQWITTTRVIGFTILGIIAVLIIAVLIFTVLIATDPGA